MKRIIALFMAGVMSTIFIPESTVGCYDLPKPEAEVVVYFSGVEVPLGRILLIRKDARYCAVKFTRCWTEVDGKEWRKNARYIEEGGEVADMFKKNSTKKFAVYNSYYQESGTGDFASKNVKMTEGTASWFPLRGLFRPFIYQPGNAYVECGPYRLTWQYSTFVSVIPSAKGMGDHGFEIAPTPWTVISQVDVRDPRITWYRYDTNRSKLRIPMHRLWYIGE